MLATLLVHILKTVPGVWQVYFAFCLHGWCCPENAISAFG
jgi:hypothetical protein